MVTIPIIAMIAIVVTVAVMMAVMPVAIVAASDGVPGQTTQDRAAYCAHRAVSGDTAQDRAAARSEHCAGGVIVPAAGICCCSDGCRTKHDDSGHNHRSCLFQHCISPKIRKRDGTCPPIQMQMGMKSSAAKAGANA